MSSSSSASATVRVEKATSDLLMGPDWTLNMDICDSVNSDNWVAKDVVKSVKKRLQHKNPKVQFLALTLLETMIKNCGEYVHFQVVEREILQEMVKIVKKKTDMQVRDKILMLLDSWQEAFGGAGGKHPQYYWAFADLRRSGVQFPERSPDSTLIFTPPVHATPSMVPQIGYGMPSNTALRLDEAMASEMANLSLSDLDSMQSVMELLSEMLKAVNPNDRSAVKDEVIVDLVNQCCSNQKKLLQSINSIRDEELLGRGLELNDNLQSLLAKHNALASGSPLPDEASESIPSTSNVPQPTTAEASESTSPKTPIAPPPAAPSRYDDGEGDEDDDFAQLARRNSKTSPVVSNAQSVATSNQPGSSSRNDITTSIVAVSMDGSSSSPSSNALTLPNPPTPVRTSAREQDIIDFLSITLSSTPSHPRASDQNASPRPVPPPQQINPQSPPSYHANQAYIPQNTFVAPWARPQPQPQIHSPSPPQSQPRPAVLPNTSAYPPPPWAIDPVDTNSTADPPNPFLSTTYQYPAPGATAYSTQPSRPPQQNSSLGSRVNNAQVTLSGAQATTIGQMGTSSAKPYVYTKRLFDDLDWRNPSAGLKTDSPPTGFSGTPGEGMVNGRK